MNYEMLQAIINTLKKVAKPSMRLALVLACLFGALNAFAQHDVALEKSVDKDSVAAGTTVTFTIRVLNQNMTNVAGLQVRDTLVPGLTYISHVAAAGTTYDVSNGIWMIGSQLNATTPELVLTITTRVEGEGMYMNIAEVVAMSGTDVDSAPNNEELLEDDMDKACVSVPITICSQLKDSIRVTLLPMFTDIQWYKDGVLIPASQGGTQDTFYITSAGLFAFTATQNGCPTLTCCPVVVKDSCYDLALRKTLAIGQNGSVIVGSVVNFNLEIINQGDLAAKTFSVIDYADPAFFAPFNLSDNPPGITTGSATIPYVWSAAGNDGIATLNGTLLPGQSVNLPVALKAVHGGQATNFAEINADDERDVDSQPESQQNNGNSDSYVDNEINNNGGDEDDHDGATLTVLASSLGDIVWFDLNHDGQQDANEVGAEGAIVHLYDVDHNLLAADTTDADGRYFFNDLPPGSYYVVLDLSTLPAGSLVTLQYAGNPDTDNDADATGTTQVVTLAAGQSYTSLDLGIFPGDFDLALEKMLSPGQSPMVDIGNEVSYTIRITNEGNLPAYHIDVNDNIPAGLALSPNELNWTMNGANMATYVFPGPLLPGQSASIELRMVVIFGASGQQIVNVAEITSAEDNNGTVYTDLDSTPNNGNPDEDDIDEEMIELIPHDPTGWIYCDKTGKIITGGTITVTGPNGIPNSQVYIVHDGSEGYYEFYTNGTPGIYTLSYSHPLGFPLSPNCPPLAGPFDPTGLQSPVVLGSDTLNAMYLENKTCAANPFYLSFEVQPNDPIILHNNIPVQCIFIGSIVCDDANHNDQSDAGDQPIAGATVHLYDCADTSTPLYTTTTDSLGHYRFDGLEPGNYMVGYDLQPSVRPISTGVIDANGFSPCITLTWGQCDTNTVICLYTCPDVSAGPDLALCSNGESVQLSATVPHGNGGFTWSPSTGLSNPNIPNPVAMPLATTTYTVTYNDGLGCVDTDAMTITIGNPFPYLTNGPFVSTTIDCTSPLSPIAVPTFADACGGSLTVTVDSSVVVNPCGRVITRTWTATNSSGNSTTFTQTVTVEDNTPPVLFATHAFFGEITHGDTLYADCAQIPSLDSLGFSAYDFCSATTTNFTENVTYGNCAVDGYLQSRYCGWTAIDACGNVDSLYFTVIITDNQPPLLAGVPANVNVPCGQSAPAVASVTATDLCDGNLPVSFSQAQASAGCTTTITRTWSATDACGNTVSASQIITVTNDNQPPVFAGIPANTTGTCGNIPPVPANVTATDNCGSDVEITLSESITGTACNYLLTRTWTATDACSNVATATQTINLTDNDTPVLVGVPANTTASCGSLPPAPTVTATDGCDTDVTVTFSETQTGAGCAFTVTRTWTATDDCGHVATASQIINVVDDQGPAISVTAPGLTWLSHGDTLIRQCNQVISLAAGSAVAVDACCSTPPTLTFFEWVTAGSCPTTGYLQLMTCGWVATDCCGNVDSLFFTVIVTDTIPPKLYGVPSNLVLPCGQTPSANLPNVVAVDNCTNNIPFVFTTSTVNIPGGYIVTRTWSATDACGNVGTKSQTITVTLTDVVPPIMANVPPDISLGCGSPIPPVPPMGAGGIMATDNCDATPTLSFNESISGGTTCYTITRTWTATDDDGNTSTATQVITVEDNEAPVLAGIPADATAACGNIPPPATVTATDNCSANVQVTYSEAQTGSGCDYTLTRTWTATDDCGNTATHTQVILVNDAVPPVFAGILPQNLTVDCASIPAPATLTATDVCDANVQVTFNEVQSGSGCDYTLTRMWTATDNCGNTATHTQVILVNDAVPPVFAGILPQDLTVDCASIPAPATVTATDICDANVQVTFNEVQTGSGCDYTLTRTWTATDDCGNTATHTQVILVNDAVPPVFAGILPQDLAVDCASIPVPATLTATDVCDANVQVTYNEVQSGSGCDYTLTRTWTATDDCGNTATHTQVILVNDAVPPVFAGILPQDLTVDCASIPAPATLTATDVCDANVQVTYNEVQTGSGCDYTLTRTWTATDNCGNQSIAQQILTVTDYTPPVMFAIHAFFGEIKHGDTLYADCSQIPSLDSIGFSAYDLCGATTTNFTENVVQGNCSADGFTELRYCGWTATDACGNTDTLHFTVIISDQLAPTIVGVPVDATAECGQVPPVPNVTATDNCDQAPVLMFSETTNSSGCDYTLTRTWTATDDCGNQSIAQQILTVTDNAPPVMFATHAFFGEIKHGDTLYADCSQIPSLDSIGFSAYDLCGATTTNFTENVVQGNCSADGFTELRYCGWTATDACGNTDTLHFTVIISDQLAPTIVGGPADITVECGQVPPVPNVTATDNCDPAPVLVFSETTTGSGCDYTLTRTWTATDDCGNTATHVQTITVVDSAFIQVIPTHPLLSGLTDGDTLVMDCNNPSVFDASDALAFNGCSNAPIVYTESITPGDCATDGYVAILQATWSATDTCGNTASVTLYMVIGDNEPPVFSDVSADQTINCGEPLPPCGNPTVTDACGDVTLTVSTMDVPTANGYDHICTWEATDACGNTATASSTVHVIDTGMPVISGVPADTTIYLANNETVPPPANVTATDGCPAVAIPVVFSEATAPMGTNGCMTKITRTWTATDNGGNAIVQQQVITVISFMDVSIAATAPDTCGMGVGSATLLPADYDYAWHDGGVGSTRDDLNGETYSVTVTAPTGCTTMLTVTIGDQQLPLTITAIDTTPATCTGGDGTATIAPANYNYEWSDTGFGAVRTDLAAGTYSVTATNGMCNMVIQVNIADGCDCIPAALTSLNTTDAYCGSAVGTATLNLVGDVADYSFTWSPDLGTPNAEGNARSELPGAIYTVTATFRGNSICVEQFQFEIFDDCPKCSPTFAEANYTVSVPSSPAPVCLPVPHFALAQQDVELDGLPHNGNLTACDARTVVNYGFDGFPVGSLHVKWQFATGTFYTVANDLGTVAAFMNHLDANGHWSFDGGENRFVSGNLGGNYGDLQITHLPTGEVQTSKAKMAKAAMGTSLYLAEGPHQMVLTDTILGCSDTLSIMVNVEGIVLVSPSTLRPDTLRTNQGAMVKGEVLANDDLRKKIKQLTIAEQPASGTAWVNKDNTVSYRPLIEYCNTYDNRPLDNFNYEVCFEDGTRMQATVSVEVVCEELEPTGEITLYPNPASHFVYVDLSPIAGQPVVLEVFNNLGVRLQAIKLAEAPSLPLRLALNEYAAGHYAIVINSPGSRPFVHQLIVGGR